MAKGKSIKIGATTFDLKECGLTKAYANTTAELLRQKGKMARVISNSEGKGYCVFEGPTSKTIVARNVAKKAAAKVTGTKKKAPATRRKL